MGEQSAKMKAMHEKMMDERSQLATGNGFGSVG
jgi:hypothetical protein